MCSVTPSSWDVDHIVSRGAAAVADARALLTWGWDWGIVGFVERVSRISILNSRRRCTVSRPRLSFLKKFPIGQWWIEIAGVWRTECSRIMEMNPQRILGTNMETYIQ
jgi:hypothetical protein